MLAAVLRRRGVFGPLLYRIAPSAVRGSLGDAAESLDGTLTADAPLNLWWADPETCERAFETMSKCRGMAAAVDAGIGGIAAVDTVDDDDLSPPSAEFDVERYFEALNTLSLGKVLLHSRSLQSTQTLMTKWFAGAGAVGALCVADHQVGGRGRGRNVWLSSAGCLMFTLKVVLPLSRGPDVPFLQYLISLALVRTVRRLSSCASIDLRIKWPNDLYVNKDPPPRSVRIRPGGSGGSLSGMSTASASFVSTGSNAPTPSGGSMRSHGLHPVSVEYKGLTKVGGVLIESEVGRGGFEFAIGVGLNVSNEWPTVCLSSVSGRPLAREDVLAKFLNVLEPMLAAFQSEGFGRFMDEYTAAWLHTGQKVQVAMDAARTADGESCDGGGVIEAEIVGLARNGALLARRLGEGDAGTVELHPDGNSFDFMNGLIARKDS